MSPGNGDDDDDDDDELYPRDTGETTISPRVARKSSSPSRLDLPNVFAPLCIGDVRDDDGKEEGETGEGDDGDESEWAAVSAAAAAAAAAEPI